jgi:hypothetical protein
MQCSTQGCNSRPATYKVWLDSHPNVLIMCCVVCASTAAGQGAKIRRVGKGV